jgi:hypothetical protein|tara:strand:+ start:2954 stop:3811 length:858 start_codon:yes stop_codon:yes gene_type:complete
MGQYKYKLKEAPGDNLPKVNKNDKYKVGYTTIDNDTKSTITDIDPETGRISWGIKKLPNLEELFNTSTELTQVAKDVYIKAKSDKKLRLIYDEARALRNKIRTHMRNEYPEEYRRVTTNMNEGDLDEMSTTGGGANAASFSGGTGMQYATPYAFRKTKKKQEPIPENIGADLGPGPKASEDGVKDNAYVKQFGYKLVPKKIKGSGIIVKQLFEKEEEEKKNFQLKRIEAFDGIEEKLNDIYTTISNAKNKTIEYYKENPDSYKVIKPTDLIMDYLEDIKKLLKEE